MQGDKAISYFKSDIENCIDPNAKLHWLEMVPDLAIGRIKDSHKAGIISVKLSIHDKTKDGPIDFS